MWTLVALPLGPLFVPIAMERVQRDPGVAAVGTRRLAPPRAETETGLRVLVGLDGSPDSERALAATVEMFGPHCALLVLAQVVHFEAAEFAGRTELAEASQRLARLAAGAEITGAVHTEVLTGAPAASLLGAADQHEVDMLVVGRRGRGLTARVLGSVSADIVQRSSVPVLVIEPAGDRKRSSKSRDLRHRSLPGGTPVPTE